MRFFTILCLVMLGSISGHAQAPQQVTQPDSIAGRWETSDGRGGYIGMNILISTTVSGTTTSLIGVPQSLHHLLIGIYQRAYANEVPPFGFNFFSTSLGGGATWEPRHLRVDMHQKSGFPAVHLDLLWNAPAHRWTGSFQRGAFQNQAIILTRPHNARSNPFVGTWFRVNGAMNNCLHIAQAMDGTFTAWSDDVQIPGRLRYANGLRPPTQAPENYGEIAAAKLIAPDRIQVELRANTAICCSLRFEASLSDDGTVLLGGWSQGPNQPAGSVRWNRLPSDSCTAAASKVR